MTYLQTAAIFTLLLAACRVDQPQGGAGGTRTSGESVDNSWTTEEELPPIRSYGDEQEIATSDTDEGTFTQAEVSATESEAGSEDPGGPVVAQASTPEGGEVQALGEQATETEEEPSTLNESLVMTQAPGKYYPPGSFSEPILNGEFGENVVGIQEADPPAQMEIPVGVVLSARSLVCGPDTRIRDLTTHLLLSTGYYCALRPGSFDPVALYRLELTTYDDSVSFPSLPTEVGINSDGSKSFFVSVVSEVLALASTGEEWQTVFAAQSVVYDTVKAVKVKFLFGNWLFDVNSARFVSPEVACERAQFGPSSGLSCIEDLAKHGYPFNFDGDVDDLFARAMWAKP